MTLTGERDAIKAVRLVPYEDKSVLEKDPRDESIYRLIPVEMPPPPKQRIYRSIFADQARQEYKRGIKPTASMGPAKVYVNKPSDFLKKHEKEPRLPQPKEFHYKDAVRRPSVPKKNEAPVIPEPTKKDFIQSNAVQIIHSRKRRDKSTHATFVVPKNQRVDSAKYVNKRDYGKVPKYLEQEKQKVELKNLAEKMKEEQRREEEQKKYQILTEEERLKILQGLQMKWEKLNSDYQKLSLTVDTVPKINRKVNMESQLRILEQDIAKFSQPHLCIKLA